VSVVTIEAEDLGGFGVLLSEPVRAAVPVAVDAVLCILGATAALRERAAPVAQRWSRWVPGDDDVAERVAPPAGR
jgi:hypothetical protein